MENNNQIATSMDPCFYGMTEGIIIDLGNGELVRIVKIDGGNLYVKRIGLLLKLKMIIDRLMIKIRVLRDNIAFWFLDVWDDLKELIGS